MKIWKYILVFVMVALISAAIFNLKKISSQMTQESKQLTADLQKIAEENKELTRKTEYLKHPENLLKELKSQFNYVEDGEKVIILVPGKEIATSTTE